MKENMLKQMYTYDRDKSAFVIEVSLDDYGDIYNEWDYAQIKRKDINQELKAFLEECAADISTKYKLILHFHLPKAIIDRKREETARMGLEQYFGFIVHTLEREWTREKRKGLFYMVVSFCLLSSAFLFREVWADELFFEVFNEGLFIGGWVFLWNALSKFFIENSALRQKRRQYRRFLQTEKEFFYE